MRAISPIIAIIIILLITIAIAGSAYSYLTVYWTGLTNKQIQVLDAFCIETGNQGKVTLRNIGTGSFETNEITVIDASSGEDITQDIRWSSSISGPDVSEGLVNWWKFDGEYTDSAGGNDGTPYGSSISVEMGVLNLYNTDDYVRLSSDISLANSNWTTTAWIKSTKDNNAIIGNYLGGPSANRLLVSPSWICYAHYPSDPWQYENGTSNVSDGNWHFLTWANHDDETIDLYVDGVVENNGAPSRVSNTGPVNQIGKDFNGFTEGSIDNVMIFDRALSENEIKQLAGIFTVQAGQLVTFTHSCSGYCRYNIVLGGGVKETSIQC